MNTSRYFSFITLLAFIFCLSCSDSDDNVPTAPSNLVLNTSVSQDGSGEVEIKVSATGAVEYQIDPGEEGAEIIISTTGVETHSYSTSGDYTIKVTALSASGESISSFRDISIVVIDSNGTLGGYETPMTYAGYDLVWSDEFDGTTLSSDWTHEIGTGSNGWGNNELQYYKAENTKVADGYLTITAKNESFGGKGYTSSRIITQGKKSFKYGRIDIRAILPQGQGLWPALWMLGSNFSTVGWPYCGEIDIMEMIGGQGRENEVFGTLHWDNAGSYACTCGQGYYKLSSGIFANEFHVFSLVWDANAIKWYVDDNLYNTISITPSNLEEFQKEFFFIFNIAVGGNLPGSPNTTTVFPQQMIVDYVRVFQ